MPIDPKAVGATGKPSRRSWTSKDALLYAVGVGAGTSELPFTTENTKDVAQRVLPTFAVIVGGGGVPMDKIGSFNPFLMVHGTQGIELLDEIPPEGEIESVGRVHRHLGQRQRGGARIRIDVDERGHRQAAAEEPHVAVLPRRRRLGRRSRSVGETCDSRSQTGPQDHVSDARGSGADVSAVGRSQSAALRSVVRESRRLRQADPARSVHVRLSPVARCCTRCATAIRSASESMDGKFSRPSFPAMR